MILSIIAFIGVFSIAVLVHEFGHFIAARRAGVKVYEFSIGFPFSPRLFTFFRHKETEFTLRLLPLGGFVSFSKDGDDDEEELLNVSRLSRAGIMAAGSLFNMAFAFLVFVPVFMAGKHLGLVDALSMSIQTVWQIVSGTVYFLVGLLSGNGSTEGLSGPVGIAVMAGKAAGKGILPLLFFTGVLNMSLGIMNLIPFPALDGGQLLMLGLEAIAGKPFRPKAYQVVNFVGLALFAILTLAVTYRDVARLLA